MESVSRLQIGAWLLYINQDLTNSLTAVLKTVAWDSRAKLTWTTTPPWTSEHVMVRAVLPLRLSTALIEAMRQLLFV